MDGGHPTLYSDQVMEILQKLRDRNATIGVVGLGYVGLPLMIGFAEKGIKVRVTARDKNWVQVNDPTSSVTGWIYNRFLKPTEPPAQ